MTPRPSAACAVIAFAVVLVVMLPAAAADERAVETATGVVFHDVNESGVFDAGTDEPLAGVAVSNGREVVTTDDSGRYELPVRGHTVIFVIKPRGYAVPVDELQIPRFYYVHSPEGAAGENFPGVEPTGPLPDSIDFPLYPQDEPDRFEALVFGDTQPVDLQQIHYMAHDTIADLVGTDAAFGLTLGDLVHDDLDLFDPLNEVIATIGVPWRHVIGNHDLDYSAEHDDDARGAYHRTYGPSYYAFSYGSAHFIAVDNARLHNGRYRTGLGEDQLAFLRNEFERVAEDRLIVLMMHIPWVDSTGWAADDEREAVLELLGSRPHAVSLAAHRHRHYHRYMTEADGLPEGTQHHVVSMGTICGNWWTGFPDEYGIPHAMMRGGRPTGHGVLKVDGNDWKLWYEPSRRPSDFQMHVHTPDAVEAEATAGTEVRVNVFNALPDAEVQMRIGEGEWQPMQTMERREPFDPFFEAALEREESIDDPPWPPSRTRARLNPPLVLWQATLPEDLPPGAHVIHVRSEDDWWTYEGRRIIRVEP